MLKFAALLVAMAGISAHALAAENQSAVSSQIAGSARYQIVQSEMAARWTFRIDRICGSIAQLVVDSQGDNHWDEMNVLQKPACNPAGGVSYQVFTSGLAVKLTFLMNTNSGQTWQLVEGKDGNPLWQKLL